jgi:DNA polymerase-3 subunit beta
MTIECPRRELHDAVQLAGAAATGRNTTLQIFQSLLFEAHPGKVRLVGCDGEMWVERRIPAQVSEEGSLAVGARLFSEILGSLPDGDVHVEQPNGTSLRLTLAASEYRVVGMTSEDFPPMPEVGEDATIKIKAADFSRMVESVDFAVAKESHGRPYLTGVLFSYDGDSLRVVATDTHRLAVRAEPMPGLGQTVNAIVPDRTIQVIKRLPVAPDGELTLTFGSGRLMVEADGAKIISQLLSGEFPPYERVIPSSHTRRWLLDREQFAACLRRTGVLARESAMRITLKGESGHVTLSARSEGVGEGKEDMEIVQEGDGVEIAFNGKFLLESLGPVTTEGVAIEMTENDRPALIRPAEEGSGYLCVIMPMAI